MLEFTTKIFNVRISKSRCFRYYCGKNSLHFLLVRWYNIHNLRTIINPAERSRYSEEDMGRTAMELWFNSELKLESFLYFVLCSEAMRAHRLFSPTFCGPCIVKYLRNKDQQNAFFFLNLFQYSIFYIFLRD
jgi:hypothetical protein